MSKGMIERVAMAIAESEFGRGCTVDNVHINQARAAIEAMRDPTDQMLGAFDRHCDDNGQCLVKTGYRAMIAAALNEEVGQ